MSKRRRQNDKFSELFDRAKHLLVAGETESAIRELRKLAQSNPDHAELHESLAAAYLAAKRLGDAVDEAMKALELEPGNAWMQSLIGWAYAHSGQPEEAEKWYRQALASGSKIVQSKVGLLEALLSSGNAVGAVAECSEMIAKSPDAELLGVLGRLFFCMNRAADAESELRRAMELDPHDDVHHRELGWVLARLGRFDEAVAEMGSALDCSPGSEHYSSILHVGLFALGQLDDLSETAREGLLDPSVFQRWIVTLILNRRWKEARRVVTAWQRTGWEFAPEFAELIEEASGWPNILDNADEDDTLFF